MLTCSLFVIYHRFITVIDTVLIVMLYIDSLQPLVYYMLNSMILVYTALITPLCCIYVRGVA